MARSVKKSRDAFPKLERKTIEKNRRAHMKNLYTQLSSLIPNQNPMEVLPLLDQLDHAATYIKKLQERTENLKRKKKALTMMSSVGMSSGHIESLGIGSSMPVVELIDLGSNFVVTLISELNKKFKFNEVICIHEEEGAEVMHASFFVSDDKIFHSIHSRVKISRIGVDTSTLRERLWKLVCGSS